MGFWIQLKELIDKTPWARLSRAKEALHVEAETYETTHELISRENVRISGCVHKMTERIAETKAILSVANELLFPPGICDEQTQGNILSPEGSIVVASNRQTNLQLSSFEGMQSYGIAPLAIGGSTAMMAWAGVQLLGTASTGATIAGLHGIAATNAGWAFFGGGSLATGGGGMALGHLVLPGIGVAVAVTCSALFSNSQAKDLEATRRELRRANIANQTILAETKINAERLEEAEKFLDLQSRSLEEEVRAANQSLLKYGCLSRIFRCLRYLFTGTYYSPRDTLVLTKLGQAIKDFMKAFGAEVA